MDDLILEKDTRSQLLTTKEGEQYRFTLITSSAFEDRDGEIISEKALERDCDEMELTGDYGELLWWHCDGTQHAQDKEARPYIPLGKVDISLVSDKLNFESGLYYDNSIGQMFEEKAADFGASKSFYHLEDEPKDGVYNFIRTKERSILPRTKEANLLTRLFGQKEKEMADNKERIAALQEKLGKEKTDELLAKGKAMTEQAEKFLKSKEKAEEEVKKDKEKSESVLTFETIAETEKAMTGNIVQLRQTMKEMSDTIAAQNMKLVSQTKEFEDVKTTVAELTGMVGALIGVQPKGGFKASEKGASPELTDEQKKLAKETEKSFSQPDITDWLISGVNIPAV